MSANNSTQNREEGNVAYVDEVGRRWGGEPQGEKKRCPQRREPTTSGMTRRWGLKNEHESRARAGRQEKQHSEERTGGKRRTQKKYSEAEHNVRHQATK